MQRVEVRLYGSLSATGIGHGTDRAVVMGLMGERPDQVDPDAIGPAIDGVRPAGRAAARRQVAVPFDWERDMRLLPVTLPYHPNAMRIAAHGADGVLYENTYYSVGGGFVVDEAQAQAGQTGRRRRPLRHEFDSAAELLAICRRHGLRISQVMLENEGAWRSEDDTRAALHRIWEAMRGCVARGMAQEGILPGGLEGAPPRRHDAPRLSGASRGSAT